jgi:hypothetical protein
MGLYKIRVAIICACYSWEMALNVGLDASFDNVKDWNGSWGINIKKTRTANYDTSY